jgi:hypothetical protein
MRGQALIRPYPGRFFGVRLPYLGGTAHDDFYAAWKEEVPIKMWDPLSKTWWVPEDMLAVVMAFLVGKGVAKQSDFARVGAEVNGREDRNETKYLKQTLGLQPDAPPGLVDAAYFYWKAQCSQAIGAGAQLQRIEEAYALLKSGNLTKSPDPEVT